MPSEPSSPDDRCTNCGHIHLPNTHTCGYATAWPECCECKKRRCAHESYEHLGTTTGDGQTLLHRKCEDCGERFSVELPDDSINCRCGHIRHRHQYATEDGPCSKPDCECTKYAPAIVENVEPRGCTSPSGCAYLLTNDCAYGCRRAVEELTKLGQEMELPPSEGPEYRPCTECGHVELTHDQNEGHCTADPRCGCSEYQPEHRCNSCGHHEGEGCGCPEHDFVSPEHCDRCASCAMAGLKATALPQPERRPPYAVAYSVGGHLYETFVPGDATVVAVDGGLVIKHTDPVIGIVQVQPVRTEK